MWGQDICILAKVFSCVLWTYTKNETNTRPSRPNKFDQQWTGYIWRVRKAFIFQTLFFSMWSSHADDQRRISWKTDRLESDFVFLSPMVVIDSIRHTFLVIVTGSLAPCKQSLYFLIEEENRVKPLKSPQPDPLDWSILFFCRQTRKRASSPGRSGGGAGKGWSVTQPFLVSSHNAPSHGCVAD